MNRSGLRFAFRALSCALCFHAILAAAESNNSDDQVSHGAYMARAADCIACHTAPDKPPFSGGRAMQTPIGTIYSPNITPDRQTGIGNYSEADFERAVRQGIKPDGSTMYPAMPYPSYAKISASDLRALYAYFMRGVEPVHEESRSSNIPWPLSMRWPLSVWRKLFASAGASSARVKSPSQLRVSDAMFLRGKYLVEGPGHCGACHTPRSYAMQELTLSDDGSYRFLSGGAALDGWAAKNLRGDAVDGLSDWSEVELAEFMKTGRTDRTAAFGPMAEVVQNSLQYLTDDDLAAIARYLKSLPIGSENHVSVPPKSNTAAELHNLRTESSGARLYIDNCMACHRSDGNGYPGVFPRLGANPVVNGRDATSLISIVLRGSQMPATRTAVTAFSMPAFAHRLSNEEVADVVSFIRSNWTNREASVTASEVAQIRARASETPNRDVR
jgi:alcohol dehydrogenase (quinone), cytochrome c subunit